MARFSLRWLFVCITIVALELAALQCANPWGETIGGTLMAIVVCYGAIRGVVRKEPFWIGFGIGSFVVLLMSYNNIYTLPHGAWSVFITFRLQDGSIDTEYYVALNRMFMQVHAVAWGLVMGLMAKVIARGQK